MMLSPDCSVEAPYPMQVIRISSHPMLAEGLVIAALFRSHLLALAVIVQLPH